MSEVTSWTLIQTLKGIKNKEISEKELVDAYQKRIANIAQLLNCYLYINANCKGIPAAVKDVIVTKGVPTTAGSKIIDGFIPPYNATVVDKLTKHDIDIIGKTNCDEFGMGSSGENSAYGPTKNPWDKTKVPGGSSSGSAAAVAADLCVFALGTDTGGSIRQPASLCGVVGLKPSYGRVSRYGTIAMASSLDQIGPITKTVADSRLVLEWISGGDQHDSNCLKESFMPARSNLAKLSGDSAFHLSGGGTKMEGVRIGVPREYFTQGLDGKVKKVIESAIKILEDQGAKVVDIELPHTEYAIATYYIVMASEVSSNMSRFDGIRFGHDRSEFGPEVKRRIMLGTYSLSYGYYDDYFQKAAKVRTLIKQDFEKAFEKCDVIAGPVSPTTAWNIGEKVEDPLAMYLSDVYTVPASLAGIPGISVPCGFVPSASSGQVLPVGLQLLGKYMDEATILDAAEVYEQSTDWHTKKPGV